MPSSGNFLPPNIRVICGTGRQSHSKPTTTKITCICFQAQWIALSVTESVWVWGTSWAPPAGSRAKLWPKTDSVPSMHHRTPALRLLTWSNVLSEDVDNGTSSSAIAERPRCRVGQFWPKVENDILQYRSIFNHCEVISLQRSYRIWWNKAK